MGSRDNRMFTRPEPNYPRKVNSASLRDKSLIFLQACNLSLLILALVLVYIDGLVR